MLTATSSRLYACNNHGPDHDLFLSYRVATDADTARELKQMLSLAALRRYGKPLAVFHDVDCLVDARDWRDGFLGALPKSKVVILLLSQASMDLMKDKVLSSQEDNVVLEIKTALDLKDANPALPVLPLGIATKETKDGVDVFTPFLPHKVSLPDDPAFASVKETLGRMNQIQMFGIRPDQMHQRVYRILNLLHPVQVDSATKIALYDSLFCDSKFRVDPAHLDTLLKQLTLTGRAVISGMGGMGKSVLALQILHFMMGTLDVSNKDDLKTVKDETIGIKPQYNQVFWINCSTESTALDGLCELFDGVEPEKVKKHAAKFLANTHGYLLVLDNVDDISVVDSVFEHSKSVGFSGDVVVTTRLASLPPGAFASALKAKNPGYRHDPLRLGNWDDATTLDYIQKISPIFSEKVGADATNETLKRIMTKIDGYPLVIQTFMTFYENNEVPLSEIERLFSKVLEEQEGEDETRSSLKVIVDLSLDSIMKRGNEGIEAARLFGALSLVAPTNIQFELIKEIVQKMELKTDVTDLIKMVIQSGLLRSGAEGLYSTHSLTQQLARSYISQHGELRVEDIEDATGGALLQLTVSLLADAYPYAGHLDRFASLAVPDRYTKYLHQATIYRIASMAETRGFFGKARDVYEPYVDRCAEFYGRRQHPEVATAMHYLGDVVYYQGDYGSASKHYEEALGIFNEIYGPHRYLPAATTIQNMGNVAYKQGDYETALAYFKEAQEFFIEMYGTREHANVAATNYSLGQVANSQGHYEAAQAYYQEALEIESKVYGGRDHPEVATTIRQLGSVANAQGNYDAALAYYQEVLATYTKAYGTREHPSVATTLFEMGNVAFSQDNIEAAFAYYQEALDIKTKAYGTRKHPEVGIIIHRLGKVVQSRGDYDQAEALYQEALSIGLEAFKSRIHEHVALVLDASGTLKCLQGELAEAQSLLQEALDIFTQVYKTRKHPDVATTLRNLGDVALAQGDVANALALYQEALAIWTEAIRNPNHKDIVAVLGSIATVENKARE
ncbi:uncharacterized protein BJ171DRAFT_602263 [Polychytrium aggregatum]|uniref:uncharacterized protein n=1 Tax=Polychytrium aggregatum TaxID=110093 RepID=UPI0022FE16F6|nr:uncharacterized protein BJ171DRAFT_602263 [Polychytrium aggregatum]KAI9197285.1 hypothetical protein BJ171DRAFT_602263 [Polychytrium aggregatum]